MYIKMKRTPSMVKGGFMQQIFFSSLVIFLFAGCADVTLSTYEGKSTDNIVNGQGGTKSVDNGIEIWDSGTPPHRYKILGMATIADFDNPFGRSRIKNAIVDQAKSAGADGVIMLNESGGGQTMVIASGFNGSGAYAGSAMGGGFNRKTLRIMLVKYLD